MSSIDHLVYIEICSAVNYLKSSQLIMKLFSYFFYTEADEYNYYLYIEIDLTNPLKYQY